MKIKTVFISDIHLGTISCKHEQLLAFLKDLENDLPEKIYLVGDIVDLWKLGKGFSWKPEHNTIVQKLLRLSRKGVEIYYIIGNHDEYFRSLPDDFSFGNIQVSDSFDYTTVLGKKLLVIHGDQYDTFLIKNNLLAKIGSFAYDLLVYVNTFLSLIRRKIGLPYWSLSQYIKLKAKSATSVIDIFENTMCNAIHSKGYDGVVCGHIHMPKIISIANGFNYYNCGDWTESCSALIEYDNGKIEITYYA
jgi:UDP-2,3-diacylglucosamine pyrophosphatase LpxH